MKALVKAQARARHLDGGRAGARDRPQRRADQGREDRDLRHRHPHLQLGRTGRRRPSRCRWSSATSSAARSSRLGSEVHGLHSSATASPAKATSPAATAATAAPAGATSAATPSASASTGRAASPSTSCIPAFNAFQLPDDDPRRDRRDLRPVRQRRAHRAVLRPGRRGRADHRRRPDRHHGGRDRPARRRAPRRHHRRQRLPARPRAQDGRDARRQRDAARRSTT